MSAPNSGAGPDTIDQADVTPLAVSQGGADAPMTESAQSQSVLCARHPGYVRRPKRVHVALAGPTGVVGSTFLRLMGERGAWLRDERDLELTLVGAINRRRMFWNEEGTSPRTAVERLQGGSPQNWEEFASRLASHRGAPLLFIDCTASEDIARRYMTLLRSGIAVVTPNKIANSLEFSYYQELRRVSRQTGVPYLYETTVGAATPMVQTLQDLRRTGDAIHRVEGVLSGTLSYVFAGVNRGNPFSVAVREAAERGLTEPHPASDLSGEDVARKLLILVREAGYRLERSDITVEPLVPDELRSIRDAGDYLRHIALYDGEYSERAARAAAGGKRLAYLARFDGSDAHAGVAEVGDESPFVHLRASENAVHYYTDRHSPLPLTIQGLGAGPEVTARGVLADVIHAALDAAA